MIAVKRPIANGFRRRVKKPPPGEGRGFRVPDAGETSGGVYRRGISCRDSNRSAVSRRALTMSARSQLPMHCPTLRLRRGISGVRDPARPGFPPQYRTSRLSPFRARRPPDLRGFRQPPGEGPPARLTHLGTPPRGKPIGAFPKVSGRVHGHKAPAQRTVGGDQDFRHPEQLPVWRCVGPKKRADRHRAPRILARLKGTHGNRLE
jgi:hypothetical protein